MCNVMCECNVESGVNLPLLKKNVYLEIKDTFLHPLNAGRCGIHLAFLGRRLKICSKVDEYKPD